jgi:DNA-binding transcriptional LysR family regulator
LGLAVNLRQIEVFRAVMNTGSFTRAAELLHVSQPGISRMMRHLEIQLGVTLFERNHGRVAATPEAHALHVEVERAYRGVETVQDFALQLREGAKTVLRIVTSPNLGLDVVPGAVVELSRRYPAARIWLDVQQRAAQMTDLLVTEQADIGISALALDHPLLAARAVGQWKLVCVMRSDHPLVGRRVIDIADVAGEPLIAFHKDTMQGRVIREWLAREGIQPPSEIEVRSGQMACSLVANGAGIAFVDDVTARAFSPFGLVFRPTRENTKFGVHAVLNKERPAPMLAKALCDLVARRMRSSASS